MIPFTRLEVLETWV